MRIEPSERVRGLVAWARRHRRLLIVLVLLSLFFSVLGYFTNPVSLPGKTDRRVIPVWR